MSILNEGNPRHHQSQQWIGLAWVSPKSDNDALGGAIGAYVIAVAFAENREDYATKTTEALADYGFDVLEFEDIEPFEQRAREHSPSPDILDLAELVSEERPVAFGAFHSYRADDDAS